MFHEERSRPMHGLQVGLFHRFDRDKAHGRPVRRFADRFRISSIILVDLDVRLDIFRVHQLDGMPTLFKRPPPVLRTPARLHPDHTGRQTHHPVHQLTTLHASAEHRSPSRIHPVSWNTFFATSIPNVVMCITAPPFLLTMSVGCVLNTTHLASCEARVGRRLGPFH